MEEIEAAVAILKGLDQDGNGELTSDEFGPVMTPKKQQIFESNSAPDQQNQTKRRNTAEPSRPSPHGQAYLDRNKA